MVCIIPILSLPKASFFNEATDKISLLLPTASRPAVQQAFSRVNSELFGSLDFVARPSMFLVIVAAVDDMYVSQHIPQ